MLAKRERLTKSDFDRFFASGKRYHTPYFTLIHSPHSEFHGAVVVSKKILRSAVGRNRARRRLYDILRRYARSNGATGVYIMLLKKEAIDASNQILTDAVTSLLGQIDNKR